MLSLEQNWGRTDINHFECNCTILTRFYSGSTLIHFRVNVLAALQLFDSYSNLLHFRFKVAIFSFREEILMGRETFSLVDYKQTVLVFMT